MANIELLKKTITSAQKSFLIADKENILDFAKESGFAMQILKSNDYLSKLNPDSIRDSIIQIALTGLTLNPALKFAYLIPRGGKCTLDISYMGMIKILTDAGTVKNIDAAVVYEGDEFEFIRGTSPNLHHKQNFKSPAKLGAYAVAYFRDGGSQAEFLPKYEIEKISKTSESLKNEKTAKFSPWTNWEDEMWKKTALKRLFKLLPKTNMSESLISALNNENKIEVDDLPTEQKQSNDELFSDVEIITDEKQSKEPIQTEIKTED